MDLPVPDTAYTIHRDEEGTDGYAFGRPPGLRPEQWPCSRDDGLPMAHLFTVRVPAQYRCAGPELVGLSVFQDKGWWEHAAVPGVAAVIDGAEPPPHEPEHAPYWSAITAYVRNRHPNERYYRSRGEDWAWIWLTEAELGGPPCPLPDPTGRLLQFDPDDDNAWLSDQPPERLSVTARVDDPNAGRAYYAPDTGNAWAEQDEGYRRTGYIQMSSDRGEELGLDRFLKQCHFGGTASPAPGAVGGESSPFYLGFEQWLGEPVIGDGVGRIDLLAETVESSC